MRISTDTLLPEFAKNFSSGDPLRRSTLFALAVLTVIGCLYYGSYYNYFFNWADEGSVALIAERLANGERPFVDVETGTVSSGITRFLFFSKCSGSIFSL